MTTLTLVERLKAAGQQHKGTELGALLQWAALHIAGQDEAIEQWEIDFQEEHAERIRLEQALHEATQAVDSALQMLKQPVCPPIEFSRDFAPHINLMAGHGDPDYLMRNGQSIRHIDTRTSKPRKAKEKQK